MKLKKKTLKELLAVIGIIMVSTLPYFHDVITERGVGTRTSIPNLGIETFLTNSEEKVLGFSSYRVFLYTLFIHLFAHIGFVGWMMDAKGKSYRIALLVPVVLSGYTVIMLLLDAKESPLSNTSTKFFITIATTLVVFVLYFLDRRNKLNIKKTQSKHAGSEASS